MKDVDIWYLTSGEDNPNGCLPENTYLQRQRFSRWFAARLHRSVHEESSILDADVATTRVAAVSGSSCEDSGPASDLRVRWS